MKFVVLFMLIVYLSGVNSAPYDSEYAIDDDLRAESGKAEGDDRSTESSATTDSTITEDAPSLVPKGGVKPEEDEPSPDSGAPGDDAAAEGNGAPGADAALGADGAPGADAAPGAVGAAVSSDDAEQGGDAGAHDHAGSSTKSQTGFGHPPPERVRVHGAGGGEHHSEPESTGADLASSGNRGSQNTRSRGLRRLEQLAINLKPAAWRNRLSSSRVRTQGDVDVGAGGAQVNANVGVGTNDQGEQLQNRDRTPEQGNRNTLRGVGGVSAGISNEPSSFFSDWTSQNGGSLCSGANCGDSADVVGAMPSPAIKNLLSCPTCVIFPQGGKSFNIFTTQGLTNLLSQKKQLMDRYLGGQWLRERILVPWFPWARPLFNKFVPEEQTWN